MGCKAISLMERGHGAYFNRYELKIGRIYQAIISVIKYLSLTIQGIEKTVYWSDRLVRMQPQRKFRIERTLPFFP